MMKNNEIIICVIHSLGSLANLIFLLVGRKPFVCKWQSIDWKTYVEHGSRSTNLNTRCNFVISPRRSSGHITSDDIKSTNKYSFERKLLSADRCLPRCKHFVRLFWSWVKFLRHFIRFSEKFSALLFSCHCL